MTDPRLAWFAIGASCSAVLFGWPWHPRFSRYRSISFPDPGPDRQPTNPFTGKPVERRGSNPPPPGGKPRPPQCPPPLNLRRTQLDPPKQFIRMNEGRVQRGNNSGGPTTPKPAIMPKPQFPPTKSTNTPDS